VLPVALVTIYWSVASGYKWDFCVLAAFGTNHGMHFAPASAVTSAEASTIEPTVGPAGLPTTGTPLRLVGISFVRMILLVVSSKNETLIAL
jgi:hypothetical protein